MARSNSMHKARTHVSKMKKRIPDLSDFWLKVSKTLRYHQQQILRIIRRGWWEIARPAAIRPVFVVGCSRAGTTLVYKTLSVAHGLGSLNRETHDFWVDMHPLVEKAWATHALAAQDASPEDRSRATRYFYVGTGKTRWVDKNNQNGLCVPYLHALFPEAYFVYIKRNPGDNINSLIEGWGKQGKFSTWSDKLPAEVAVDNGRYTHWCFFLTDGWRNYIRAPIEEVAAFQYCSANDAILAAKHLVPPNQWIEVFYEDLVRDPVQGFRGIFESCDLQFDAALEEHCRNVLNTPYDAFGEIRLDKWRDGRNRERVERVLSTAARTAQSMGYSVG